jgi:hypothetical protein
LDGPICSIIVDERWRIGLTDLAGHRRIQVLYWMHRARGRRGIGRGLAFRDAPGNRMTTSPASVSSHSVSPRAQGVDVPAFARWDAVNIRRHTDHQCRPCSGRPFCFIGRPGINTYRAVDYLTKSLKNFPECTLSDRLASVPPITAAAATREPMSSRRTPRSRLGAWHRFPPAPSLRPRCRQPAEPANSNLSGDTSTWTDTG